MPDHIQWPVGEPTVSLAERSWKDRRADRIHWVQGIPPKFSVVLVVGPEGKSAIQVHCEALGVKRVHRFCREATVAKHGRDWMRRPVCAWRGTRKNWISKNH